MAVLALVLALLAVLPAGAHAAGDLEIGIADDAALLKEGDPERGARLVADWRATGIDAVRVFAEWRAVSPGEAGPYRPEGFNPADPDDPAYRWQDLDRAIRLVGEAGLRVILSVSGPGPLWATADPGTGDQRRRPRPDAFGVFAGAVARRYGAAVDRYIIWNEPNLPLWLKPQFSCRAPGRCVPYAPHLYRRLVRAAYEAIHANDARAEVLFGALAPRGHDPRRPNATMRPLTFLRALGCVDQRLRRTRRGPCGGFRPLTADAFAYHPQACAGRPTSRAPTPTRRRSPTCPG